MPDNTQQPIAPAPRLAADPVLIVVTKQPAAGAKAFSTTAPEASGLMQILSAAGASIQPLFATNPNRPPSFSAGGEPVDTSKLDAFYRVNAANADLEKLASQLREHELVEAAYVKPPTEPPVWGSPAPAAEEAPVWKGAAPSFDATPAVTPDFLSRQGYLNSAPEGVDAAYSWQMVGGAGAGVQIIDIEGAWRMTHEDLMQNNGGVVGGTPTTDIGWRNHGTSVLGEFSGDYNGYGITGISPDAVIRAISFFGIDSSTAIHQAADMLNPGDIILLELHRPGPRTNFQSDAQQTGYIAIEWWPDDFAAIQYAVFQRGVVVVEAGGNGGDNLDDPIYDTAAQGFPAGWTNPFRQGGVDSGAIVVGAGCPPPGTHGRTWGPDRCRLWFSNYGSRVDVQGWGLEVTTTGGSQSNAGDLQGGTNEDVWYTDTFSGTSSASPIIVGVIANLQGIRKGVSSATLTPSQARDLLRMTGSPQQDGSWGNADCRIGNRPDFRQLIAAILPATEFNDGITDQNDAVRVA